jgi:hypothetical protein
MAKYVRKIFILSRIINTFLIVKNNPVFLLEIINFFNLPISHKFTDPSTGEVIEEKTTTPKLIKFLYFIFLENKNFSNNKEKKRGRVKRKITRKLVLSNKIVD